MNARIPHSKPTLPACDEWGSVMENLAPGWVADGPCTEAFEQAVSRYLGCSAGVAVSSGTNALHLALVAAGVAPGTEVLVPAYCCAAILNAVAQAGAVPVLVDAEPGGFNLWPEDAARRRTSRTSAVIVAHLFGEPAGVEPLRALGVPIIEDCAQSLGAQEAGRFTGGRGDFAIGSFYATKVITTGHGGFVGSADPERAAGLREWVDYDNRDDWKPRFSYRMSELQAALGLSQIDQLPGFLGRRRVVADYYDRSLIASGANLCALRGKGSPRRLGDTAGDGPVGEAEAATLTDAGRIFYRYVLRVPEAGRFLEALKSRGVDAKRPVYRPLHHYQGGDYPHAEAAHREIVSLPIYPRIADDEAEQVVRAVIEAWRRV